MNSPKFKLFLVSVNRLDNYAIKELTFEEKQHLVCYSVNKIIPKFYQVNLETINEWELPWHDNRYQTMQYYEYGAIVHAYKNPQLLEGLTHVGLFHYDMFFPKNSVKEIYDSLKENPTKILYVTKRTNKDLWLSKDIYSKLCNFLSERINIKIDSEFIWKNYWISEALSVVPVDIFLKFGEFLYKYQYEIENILKTNGWGMTDNIKHRPCGIVERMWGAYLVSLNMPLEQLSIKHDWDRYEHLHQQQSKFFKL